MGANKQTLDLPALESWLWEAACVIRGPIDAPKFKDYILPLIFLKRLSDVFDDEVHRRAALERLLQSLLLNLMTGGVRVNHLVEQLDAEATR